MDSGPHRVGDVMTRAAVAVGRKAVFKDVVERMEQWQVSALPVLEGGGRLIGVVSEADLLPKEEFRDSDPDRSTQLRRLPDLAKAGAACAEELMSTPAVTVHADATLAEAARIMALRHVKRLPVVSSEGVTSPPRTGASTWTLLRRCGCWAAYRWGESSSPGRPCPRSAPSTTPGQWDIVIRTHEGAALTSRAEEADDLLRNQRSGANDEGRGLGSGTVPEFQAAQILTLK
ncbi:CBS domain-containing protein [Streptomyces sp. NPDC003233]